MWWVLGALIGCSVDMEGGEEDEAPQPVTVVKVETVGRGSVAERVTTTAVVEAERSANVTPVSPGVVLSIHADDGDEVRRGDLLAVLDSASLAAGASRSRAEVARLEKQLTDTKKLHQRGVVSTRELEDLEYQLQTARLNAREAGRNYGQTRITAPFDGVVARRNVKLGELANGAAFQVVDLSVLRVVVDLPERDFGRVQVGQPVILESAYDVELQGRGRISRVAPVIDPTTGTFRATVQVDEGPLRPGQFVNARIEVDRQDGVATVPRDALLWEDGQPVVFVMVPAPPPEPEEGEEEPAEPEPEADRGFVAERKGLTVGLIDDASVEVLSGVDQGASVIVVGHSNLKDGAKVRAVEGSVEPAGDPG